MWTLARQASHEVEIKKSRFLALAARADGRSAAQAFLESVSDPKATHNCWALRAGQDYRFSDDGEPGGTAGQPILRAIDGQGLDCVVVVVTRWFGGIKLGAGGLSRAYGGTAAECLRLSSRVEVRPSATLKLFVPFDHSGPLHQLLSTWKAVKTEESFSEKGAELTVTVEEAVLEAFLAALRDSTRGKAQAERVEPKKA